MSEELRERAEKTLIQALPGDFKMDEIRMEVLPQDGTLLLFVKDPSGKDSLSMLRENAVPWKGLPAPFVIEPKTGNLARRYIIPYQIWAKPDSLHMALAGKETQTNTSHCASLRLWKQVPGGDIEYRYGRGGRFTLFFDRETPLLAARVFPAGLSTAGCSDQTHAHLAQIGTILLARSGVTARPYVFHMLRKKRFFDVERAVNITSVIGVEAFKKLENELIRGAEEDRKIMDVLLSSGILSEPVVDSEQTVHQRRSTNV